VSDQTLIEEIWVNVTESAEITGYNRGHVWRLVHNMWRLPEENRPIKLRKRSSGYELWLPDLMAYVDKEGRGPYLKNSENK
jgi:predicted DNA-binding transcriptional regulator AlpA